MAWRRLQTGLGVALKKRLDDLLAFRLEYRTGAVQQLAGRGQQRPQAIQQGTLDGSKPSGIIRTTQPAHIRMSAPDPRCRARCIQQNRIEQLPIPPDLWLAGIGLANFCSQRETIQVLVDPLTTACINFKCKHLRIGPHFKQMARFAPWSGAGIQNAHWPVPWQTCQQQWRCQLRCRILYRHFPFHEAWQLLDRKRLLQLQTTKPYWLTGWYPGRKQPLLVLLNTGALQVHTQGHGRCLLRPLQQNRPMFGVIMLQLANPPQRMVPSGLLIFLNTVHKHRPLSQETPQAGVDESCLSLGLALATRGLHGLTDEGMTRVRCVLVIPAQSQCTAQQGFNRRRWLAWGQQGSQGSRPTQLTQDLKTQRLSTGPYRCREHIELCRERPASLHRLNDGGSTLQQLPQRRRLPFCTHRGVPARGTKRTATALRMPRRRASQLAGACDNAAL